MSQEVEKFQWQGSNAPFLDAPKMERCGQVSIGCFGGTWLAGANKNEDAALVWTAADGSWTFAALLDAHSSSQSANLVLSRISQLEVDIVRMLDSTLLGDAPLWDISQRVLMHLGDIKFRRDCALVRGETALLLCVQKGAYLWWLSVGDIPIYVLHTEFARLGQYALNQRMFYEWIGQVNTFALPVPCYTTGVRQLRPGQSHILITTDGLLEYGDHLLEDPLTLYEQFGPDFVSERNLPSAVERALYNVWTSKGRDSATVLSWTVNLPSSEETMRPSP